MFEVNSSAPQPTQRAEYHSMPTPGLPQRQYESYGPARELESDPVLRPHTTSKELTRLERRLTRNIQSASRMISFKGDSRGSSEPTDLPYSPTKLTWKEKKVVTNNQLEGEREKKLGKLKAMKANGKSHI